MDFKKAVELLQSFCYERNGKEATIDFLEFILRKLKENTNE